VDHQTAKVAHRATLIGVLCAGLVVAVYLAAVWTHSGQRFEDKILMVAAAASNSRQEMVALAILATVRKVTMAAAILVILAVAVRRRQAYTGILGAGVVVAAALTTQILQAVFSRPILLRSGYRREDQSFPSGHTSIAMAVMVGLILVVPHRWRWYAVVLTAPWAIGMGVATVTVGWHRPSDTIGSDLIVLMYACLVIVLLARQGRIRPAKPHMAQAAAVGVVVGLLCVAVMLALGTTGSVFTFARTVVLAASATTTLALLALLRGVEFTVPSAGPPPAALSSYGAAGRGSQRPPRTTVPPEPTVARPPPGS
jgi:membrane-associated phospholipid phosphatase